MEKIILFYKYVPIEYPKQILKWQHKLCTDFGLKGRILLAHEGINATLGGTAELIERYKQIMNANPLFEDIDYKESIGSADDFPRLQITVKNTIVNMGIDPEKLTAAQGGRHLSAQEVHDLLSQQNKDLVIIDTRNDYEYAIGRFTNAINPDIKNFREFPEYIDRNIDMFKDKQVLMYCTGGVRCERATAYLKEKDVAKEVYQIKGGIHRYVEQFPDGHFRGKNYVFDKRLALKVNDDILASCSLCQKPCDSYINCINSFCHVHIISCTDCQREYNVTCGRTCQELVAQSAVPIRPGFGPMYQENSPSCTLDQ
jgi:predicted sulfurtransferase